MAAALVQTGTALNVGGGTSGTITLTGVAAGNLLVVYADDIDGLGATFSISDDQGNTWAQAVHNDNGGYTSSIHYCLNAAAGTTVITVTASTATAFLAQAQEYSGGTWTLDTTSSIDETSTTSHVCSASAAVIDTAGEDVVVCNSTTADGGNFGTRTAGSGYTGLSSPTAQCFWQYQIFSTAQANEQGPFTSANSKATAACIAAFICAASDCVPCWWPCCTECATSGFYVCGGVESGPTILQETVFYDITGATWPSKTSFPTPARFGLAGIGIAGLGYIFCGADSTSTQVRDTDEYNSADSWASKTDAPTPARTDLPCAELSGIGYIFGGYSSGSRLQDNDAYNQSGDSWTSKSNLPSPARSTNPSCDIGTKCYSTGGDNASVSRDTDEYDPSGDSWTSKTDYTAPFRYAGAFVNVSGDGYLVGGFDSGATTVRDNDQYIPDTWTSVTDLPTPGRADMAGVSIGTSAYIVCGTATGSGRRSDNDEYTPDVWTSAADFTGSARNGLTGFFL